MGDKMKTKLQNALDNYKELEGVLICPICKEDLLVHDKALRCVNKHTFNVNKKGIITFSNPIKDAVYNDALFKSRNIVLNSDIYEPIFNKIQSYVPKDTDTLVDAGTGEGTYLNRIKIHNSKIKTIGVDLSKDGLNIASNYTTSSWILSDLGKVPLKDESVDVILNILSPANYKEFNRLLTDDGLLIKVIVQENYLKEVREISQKENHDSIGVFEILDRNMNIIHDERIQYSVSVDEVMSSHLLQMTPMTQHLLLEGNVNSITIDLRILVAKKI